ncbi:MAG: rhamnulokinase [Clostridiales bacterium]|jgi:rhamnulokinase|nr:rhamnulokinase [Clostridiales bacterium]
MNYCLAIDIGASSGRHILGHVSEGRIVTEEVYRFENRLVRRGSPARLCWDTENLFGHILSGMRACAALGKIPRTAGIDTWGVDFALLGPRDNLLDDTVAYRDSRTNGMDAAVERRIPRSRLYGITGTQQQIFNTIYQLAALREQSPEVFESASRLLMLPDYFNFLLTGVKKSEYTIATTTGLVNALRKTWDPEIIKALGLPLSIFGELSAPGTTLGRLTEDVRKSVGFDCDIVMPCEHDTGSAFAASPAGEGEITLSSGTWSLMGVETARPILTEESMRGNFTNEGGYGYRNRYLKNIMGLWMIQCVRQELGKIPSFAEMAEMARAAEDFASIVDVNNRAFLAPENMTEAIKEQCRATGQAAPRTPGETLRCVYGSLAQSYADTVRDLSAVTGRRYTGIRVIGGGCRDIYLNTLTAKATGLTVSAGPVEGTAIGNLIAQMLAAGRAPGAGTSGAGEFESLDAARGAVRRSI